MVDTSVNSITPLQHSLCSLSAFLSLQLVKLTQFPLGQGKSYLASHFIMHYPLSIIHYSLPFPPPHHQAPKAQKSLKALWSPWREIFYCACFDNYANIFSDFNKSTIHLFSLPHTHTYTHIHTYINCLLVSLTTTKAPLAQLPSLLRTFPPLDKFNLTRN